MTRDQLEAAARQPCGTIAAYRRHLRLRQVPCDQCAKAEYRYYLARRAIRDSFRQLLDLITAECRRTGMLP